MLRVTGIIVSFYRECAISRNVEALVVYEVLNIYKENMRLGSKVCHL